MLNIKKITIFIAMLLLVSCKTNQVTSSKSEGYFVKVQPIIVRSDAGEEPAKSAISEELVERVYSKVPIDFIFEAPLYLDDTKARDGIYNLDEISQMAAEKNLIKPNDGTLYMFFVNSVDRHPGPLGRGMQNGNIIFIALDDKLPPGFDENIVNMQTFVIAHEIGHNFGLLHAVNDPNVPNDVPNIQGDGAFKDRIDPKYSLNDYQIKIVKKSLLLHKKRGCNGQLKTDTKF